MCLEKGLSLSSSMGRQLPFCGIWMGFPHPLLLIAPLGPVSGDGVTPYGLKG